MKKIKWFYYFARNFSLQRYEIIVRLTNSILWRDRFGISFKHVMIKPEDGGNHAIWLDENEYARALNRIFNEVCKNLKKFYYYKQIIKQTQNRWLRATKEVGSKASKKLSNNELGQLYKIFVHHHQELNNKPIWIPFVLEPILAKATDKALIAVLKRAKKINEYNKWFEVVFSPEEENTITGLRHSLLQAAVRVKQGRLKGKKLTKAVERITDRYGFIPCYGVIDEPWDVKYFSREVNMLAKKPFSGLIAELEDLKGRFKKRRKDFLFLLRAFKMLKRERELFVMAHELVFIKDERDDFRRKGCYYARPLFTEIGRRIGLTTKESAYLTTEETEDFLFRNIATPSVAKVCERVKGYLLLRKYGGPLVVASGKEMQKIIKQELGKQAESKVKKVKGIIACQGTACGNCAIVKTKHNLRRIREGNIMVAVTTNPDFVPAMQKCKAIITDEGGITSHAAIVSRELKIPCVVGTKIATKIFRDGQTVEVDANKGVIKIVNN